MNPRLSAHKTDALPLSYTHLRVYIHSGTKSFLRVLFPNDRVSLIPITPRTAKLCAHLFLRAPDNLVDDVLREASFGINVKNVPKTKVPTKQALRVLHDVDDPDVQREIMAQGSEWWSVFNFALKKKGLFKREGIVSVSLVTIDDFITGDAKAKEHSIAGRRLGEVVHSRSSVNSLRNTGRNKHLGFFPFYLAEALDGVDLSRYQVYNVQRPYLGTEEPCVFFALKATGITDFTSVAMLDLSNKPMATMKDLKLLARALRVEITLRKLHEGSTSAHRTRFRPLKIKPDGPAEHKVELAAIRDHIFIDERTPYNLFYLRNKAHLDARFPDMPLAQRQLIRVAASGSGPMYGQGAWAREVLQWLVETHTSDPGTFVVPVGRAAYPLALQPALPASWVSSEANLITDADLIDDSKDKELNTVNEFFLRPPRDCQCTFALDLECVVRDGVFHRCLMAGVVRVNFNDSTFNSCLPEHVRVFEGWLPPSGETQSAANIVAAFEYMSWVAKVVYGLTTPHNQHYKNADPHIVNPFAELEDLDVSVPSESAALRNVPEAKRYAKDFARVNVYIHNLRYDLAIIEQALPIQQVCKKGSTRYGATFRFNDVRFDLIDSLKIMPFALSKFPRVLGLPPCFSKKENINYTFYTEEHFPSSPFWEDHRVNIEEYLECPDDFPSTRWASEEEYVRAEDEVLELLRTDPHYFEWSEEDQSANWGVYYKHYLEWDCAVLAAGLVKFNELVLDLGVRLIEGRDGATAPTIGGLLTITAVGKQLFRAAGVYDSPLDLHAMGLGGKVRSYIHQSVIGGRIFVPVATPTTVVDMPSVYFDARSLYPSANHFICAPPEEGGLGLGFPYLAPQAIPEDVLDAKTFIGDPNFPWFTVTVRVTAVNRAQPCGIPSFFYFDDDRSMHYSNSMPEGEDFVEVVVDQGTLKSWIEFHDIEYTAVCGLRWPVNPPSSEDRHPMGRVVQFLYNERLRYKREKNSGMSELCKLVMNAVSFGALIPKPAETKAVMVRDEDTLKYLANHFLEVKRARKCGLVYEVECYSDDRKATLCKWGAMVLSYSKYLMDRLFWILGELKMPAMYTDTDSVVFPHQGSDRVAAAFEERYGIPFFGKDLLQFHSEFELEDLVTKKEIKTSTGATIPTEAIVATKSYYLGKKLYFHRLEAFHEGEHFRGCKFSCKGFTKYGVVAAGLDLLREIRTGPPMERDHETICDAVELLYQTAAAGKVHNVDLFPPGGGGTRFVFEYGVGVTTPDEPFYRSFCITRKEFAPPARPEELEEVDEDQDNFYTYICEEEEAYDEQENTF